MLSPPRGGDDACVDSECVGARRKGKGEEGEEEEEEGEEEEGEGGTYPCKYYSSHAHIKELCTRHLSLHHRHAL